MINNVQTNETFHENSVPSTGESIRGGAALALLAATVCYGAMLGYKLWQPPQKVALAVVVEKYEPKAPYCETSKHSTVKCDNTLASYYRPTKYNLKISYAGHVGYLNVHKNDFDEIKIGDRIFISYTNIPFSDNMLIHYQRTNIAPPNSIAEKRITDFVRFGKNNAENLYPEFKDSYDALSDADTNVSKLDLPRSQKFELVSLYRFAVMKHVAKPDKNPFPKINDVYKAYTTGTQSVKQEPVSIIKVSDMSEDEKQEASVSNLPKLRI